MALDLYKELVEVEFLNGRIAQSQDLIELSLTKLHSILDSTDFYYLRIIQHTMSGEPDKAIESGRKILRLLGTELPEDDFPKYF